MNKENYEIELKEIISTTGLSNNVDNKMSTSIIEILSYLKIDDETSQNTTITVTGTFIEFCHMAENIVHIVKNIEAMKDLDDI
jgi:hypothetical protein